MLEYASMRFTLVCAIAATFPTVIVSAAITESSMFQSAWIGPNATKKVRRNAAKAAALGPADMNAVMGVGAPSYTSGVHMWKGTSATLNANPIRIIAIPARRSPAGSGPSEFVSASAIRFRFVVPVAPYVSAMP